MHKPNIVKIEYEYRRSGELNRYRVMWDGDVYGQYGSIHHSYTHVDATDEIEAYRKAMEWQALWDGDRKAWLK